MEETYTIAMEIKSETYFGKGLFLLDLVVIVGYWLLLSNLESLLHPSVRLPYTVFNILAAFLLTRKSRRNPGKRVYQSLLYRIWAGRGQAYAAKKERQYEEIHYEPEEEERRLCEALAAFGALPRV